MVELEFIGNSLKKMNDRIGKFLNDADQVDIAVAFLKNSGYNLLKSRLVELDARVLVGFDFCLTEIEPIQDMLDHGINCRRYNTELSDKEMTYHPKMYIFKKGERVTVIVGSSNISRGAFLSNVEANVAISGTTEDDIIKDCLQFFDEKWDSSRSEQLTEAFFENYERVKERWEEKQRTFRDDMGTKRKREAISITGKSVIICMTETHDKNDIYNRLVGVPERAESIFYNTVGNGTRIFIYVKRKENLNGILKIVEAIDSPYTATDIVPEWADGVPETYPHRINTKLINSFQTPVTFRDLQELGIKRVDTGTDLCSAHLRSTITPISESDADAIERLLRNRNSGIQGSY